MKILIAYLLLVLAKKIIVCQSSKKYVVLCEDSKTFDWISFTTKCENEKNITLNSASK